MLSDLKLRDSPQYYHFVANASNVVFNNIDIAGASRSQNPAKNTDGWNTYRSTDLTIQNSVIDNGDGKRNPGSRVAPSPPSPPLFKQARGPLLPRRIRVACDV